MERILGTTQNESLHAVSVHTLHVKRHGINYKYVVVLHACIIKGCVVSIILWLSSASFRSTM